MKKAAIVVLIILGVVVLVFLYLSLNKNRYNWFETYASKSDQPFGTRYFHDLLESYATAGFIDNKTKPLEVLLDTAASATPTTYVSTGYFWDGDSVSAAALLRFIEAGNEAFIIVNVEPQTLLEKAYLRECSSFIKFPTVESKTITANFFHPTFASSGGYAFTHRVKDEDVDYSWHYVNSYALCDSAYSIVPLGFFDTDHVNFFKIPYGKGNLFVHTNPMLFTNYFMVEESGVDYAAAVISHSPNRKIIWDDYQAGFSFNRRPNAYNNPLYYILEQPALRYAWWMMLALALIYVVFAAKRQQRFIPVVEKKTNTSLAFLKMVSSLHFRNGNNADMARKKMRYFLHTVRSRYGLHTHTIDAQFIEKLSTKSQVSQQELELIFQQYRIINNFQEIDSAPLVNLYNAIQNFYNKAK